jgi:orotate phosphoribosyltransferase
MSKSVANQVAAYLLEIEAIKLSVKKPFTWASGWKSPIYCDNRLSLSYPDIRTYIKKELATSIKANFKDVEAIAGVATAGIPQGALVAEELGIPFIYIRSKPKGHGMTNMIEGRVVKKQKTVLVEDLISTGGSSLKAADALKVAGVKVLGMAAIFTYGFDISKNNFKEAEVDVVCLSTYSAMLEEAVSLKYISEKDIISLKAWRVDPAKWKG